LSRSSEIHLRSWRGQRGSVCIIASLPYTGKKGVVALGLRNLPEYIRKVEKQLLKEVVGKNKWHINNESDQYCSPLPVEEIIQRAEHSIDMEVTYHVFGSNCERFVKTLRYGDQVSDSAKAL
ncbi:HRSL1 enzyme, partial [Grantiella picta]|nr:HRSL1 enzyme [Grantiella picta]NWV40063.1 HRSL1 enzyme [Grantiella picta]